MAAALAMVTAAGGKEAVLASVVLAARMGAEVEVAAGQAAVDAVEAAKVAVTAVGSCGT